jgi:hypothetical protein
MATLWRRLSQHKGLSKTGGGNHRGSIFRLLIGEALINKEHIKAATWGVKRNANAGVRSAEFELECKVSRIVGTMQLLWLAIDDDASPGTVPTSRGTQLLS